MIVDIVEVRVLKDYILYIKFEDGLSGEIDISKIVPFEGVFLKLKDPKYFSTVKVNTELGTIVWDNGADLAPDYIYSLLSEKAA